MPEIPGTSAALEIIYNFFETLMPQVQLTIRFLTPCLAPVVLSDDSSEDGVKRFARFRRGTDLLIWRRAWWFTPCNQASKRWAIELDLTKVEISVMATPSELVHILDPAEHVYRTHEAVPVDGTLTFELMVDESVCLEDLRSILEKVGEFIGLSPHGFKAGCGRFSVESLQ